MAEHDILMSGPLVRATFDDLKTETRRLDMRWLKAKKGDILRVKETWAPGVAGLDGVKPSKMPTDTPIIYRADCDGGERELVKRWRPSIFMCRWMVRLRLRMTADAYVERLHDITEDAARREGVLRKFKVGRKGYWCLDHTTAFRVVWESINGRASWDSNPDVVVLPFARVEADDE